MVYVFLEQNKIALLSLSKTMLGQFNTSFFDKKHSIDLLTSGKITNVDLVASALKEGLTQAQPHAIIDREIFLILPQESFSFARYSIPGDISDTAIISFVKDKLRADQGIDCEDMLHDFLITKTEDECTVLFYGLLKNEYMMFDNVFKLLGLQLKNLIPETLSIHKLFKKTLSPEKREKILYVSHEDTNSYAFLYDHIGLYDPERLKLTGEIVEDLKKEIEKVQKKHTLEINRIILSGSKSIGTRQDYFTKDVGIWTNPLEKIIQTYYADSIKLLIPTEKVTFPLLQFAVCLGAFIFEYEKDDFQPLSNTERSYKDSTQKRSRSGGSRPSFTIHKRDIFIFLVSFLLSLGIIIGITYVKNNPLPKIAPSVKPTSAVKVIKIKTPTATPSPAFVREDINVKILNGSGIKGKANEIAQILKDKKYADVVTGNADSFEVPVTELSVKKSKQEIAELIRDDLEGSIVINKTTVLSEDESADAILTIGLDIEPITPTPLPKSPTKKP